MRKRKIAVFTGNRAEYGLQLPILKAVESHEKLEYQLIVAGGHLDGNTGKTLNEIKDGGFEIHAEVEMPMKGTAVEATAVSIGEGVLEVTKALIALKPDFLVVYADRFEGFAAIIAATQMNIPTVHLEGGDLTEGGALDDSVRHAMSKLSHLHFTTNQQASNRLLAMGEESWRVHTVGFPVIDQIIKGEFCRSQEISKLLGIDCELPIVLFTQHSITTESESAKTQIQPSLAALKRLASEGVQVIITYPNNDAGGEAIVLELEALSQENITNVYVRRSLGSRLYHGILALTKQSSSSVVCAGNSSSGMKETPIFGCPTVNIGSRQSGRLRGDNVIDTDYNAEEIYQAIVRGLFDQKFIMQSNNTHNPYYLGGAGKKVANVLAEVKIDKKLIRKAMALKGEVNNGWYR